MRKAKHPLITIGMSCYNAEDTIARAIKSAQAQDWGNFEIVIVDDCSSDASVSVIKKIAKSDKRIKLHCHEKNSGLAGAINTIAEKARGDYIAFFDDDDESHPTRIGKQYERLTEFEAKHPGKPVVCHCHRRVIDGDSVRIKKAIGATPPEPHGMMVADYLLWFRMAWGYSWGSIGTLATMAPRKLLREFPHDTALRRCEDWDFSVRVARAGGYFVAVDAPLVEQYVTHSADKSASIRLETYLLFVEKHKDYLKSRRAYRGAVLFAYAKLYRSENIVKCVAAMALACIVCPKIIASTPSVIARLTRFILYARKDEMPF